MACSNLICPHLFLTYMNFYFLIKTDFNRKRGKKRLTMSLLAKRLSLFFVMFEIVIKSKTLYPMPDVSNTNTFNIMVRIVELDLSQLWSVQVITVYSISSYSTKAPV